MAAGAWEPKGPCSEPLGTGDVGLSRSRCLRQVHCLARPLLSSDFSLSIPPGGLGPPVGPGGASEGEGPHGSLPWWWLVGLARILATALCISALLGLSFPPPPTGASRTLGQKGRGLPRALEVGLAVGCHP